MSGRLHAELFERDRRSEPMTILWVWCKNNDRCLGSTRGGGRSGAGEWSILSIYFDAPGRLLEKERERTGVLLCFRSELVGLLLACLGLVACVPNACVAAAAWH